MGLKQDMRVMDRVIAEQRKTAFRRDYAELVEKPFKEAVDVLAEAAADAVYGPLIRELERKKAAREARERGLL